jgi:hypothetical protein
LHYRKYVVQTRLALFQTVSLRNSGYRSISFIFCFQAHHDPMEG